MLLYVFPPPAKVRMFVVEQGWTSEEYEKWLAQLLINTLIGYGEGTEAR